MKTGKERNTIIDAIKHPLDILKNALGATTALLVLFAAIQKAIELNAVATDAISMASLEIAKQQMIAELQFAGLTGLGYIALDNIIQLCKRLNQKNAAESLVSLEAE